MLRNQQKWNKVIWGLETKMYFSLLCFEYFDRLLLGEVATLGGE